MEGLLYHVFLVLKKFIRNAVCLDIDLSLLHVKHKSLPSVQDAIARSRRSTIRSSSSKRTAFRLGLGGSVVNWLWVKTGLLTHPFADEKATCIFWKGFVGVCWGSGVWTHSQ